MMKLEMTFCLTHNGTSSMSKVIKILDSTELKLKELIRSLEETGCSPEEKIKARKIFKIYLDGKAEINENTST